MTRKRIKAYLIDLFVHLLIFLPTIIYFIWVFYDLRENKNFHSETSYGQFFYCYTILAFGTLLLKDFRNGKSIGKKLAGIQIVNSRTTRVPNILKITLRNYINLLFIPVDVVFLWSDKSFGDMVMNTRLNES